MEGTREVPTEEGDSIGQQLRAGPRAGLSFLLGQRVDTQARQEENISLSPH
jgi:hypothetical protein